MKKTVLGLGGILLVALLAGCASPAYRIKQNPELFNSFPPDVQENVRQGRIDIGYTPEMVEMALGKPNRVYSRKTQDGETQVWSYTDTYSTPDRQRVEGTFRFRDSDGRYRTTHDYVWVDVKREHEYEHTRVEFTGNKVSAIENEERAN